MDYPKKGYLREIEYNNPSYLYGASGFNIALNEFIDWDKRFDNNEIISQNSKQKLFQPFNYEKGRLYTNGWYMDKTNNNISYYYTGSFSTGYKKYDDKNLTIIFLTNGSKNLLSINKIMKHLAGIVDSDLAEK
jgi:hypothetical protein